MLHTQTQKALKELQEAEWFKKTGQSIIDSKVITVSSWKEAMRYCNLKKWGKIEMEATNMISDAVIKISMNRYCLWNDIVAEIKQTFVPMVENKVLPFMKTHKLPIVFKHCVEWDLLSYCIECEYEDLYPNGFFRELAGWYLNGHFPCGWEGSFTDFKKQGFTSGKLVVF